MKAIKYKISISDEFRVIDEIAIDYLGAIINHTGVHFPKYFNERVTSGENAEEIELPSDILDYIETIKATKEVEQEVLKRLNLNDKI